MCVCMVVGVYAVVDECVDASVDVCMYVCMYVLMCVYVIADIGLEVLAVSVCPRYFS